MKKLSFIVLLVGSLLLGTTFAKASNYGEKDRTKSRYVTCAEQTSQMKELIGTPDFISKTTTLEIVFDLNEYNTITLSEVKTDNAELRKYVYRNLNGKRIFGNDRVMSNQSLNLVFNVQQETIFLVY